MALPHLELVSTELRHLSVVAHERARDRTLGLALVDLVDPVNPDGLRQNATIRRLDPGGGRVSDLDILLAELRRRFAASHGGWVPRMGKNRVLHGVHGLEHVSGGGAGDPRPERGDGGPSRAAAGRSTPAPERRPSGAGHGGHQDGHQGGHRGGDDARVGVLDTRIYPHERLVGRFIAPGDALIDPSAAPAVFSPWAGHATFVAGLIMDRAPDAELEVRQVLGDAHATASAWDVARMMVSFTECEIDVLNLSFGCYTADGRPPLVLARAVELLAPDIVMVAAAGNHGNVTPSADDPILTPRTPIWPAAFDDVVAVGAHDGSGRAAPFTPKDAPWISLLAPGVDIRGDYLVGRVRVRPDGRSGDTEGAYQRFDGTAVWSGTSFAAAHVSGVIAARTMHGRRTAHAARDELLRLAAGHSTEGIMPYGCCG
ncbi:MAG TPA: S8/S53 family peptidase [Mycobacteriales bacterium]|nr:S8/S53 family peptidase [Mycobacteriales bacterium]